MAKTDEILSAAEKTVNDLKTATGKTTKRVKKAAESVKKTATQSYAKLALKDAYLQFDGYEFSQNDMLEKIEADYKENGHRVSAIRSLEIYMKPEEKKVYYVINGKFTGKVDMQSR